MRAPYKTLQLLVLSVGVCLLLGMTQQTDPITKEGLLKSLNNKALSSAELVQQVERRGVNFILNPTDEVEIRSAGKNLGIRGLDDLIRSVRNNYRAPAPVLAGVLVPAEEPEPKDHPCGGRQKPPGAVTIYYGNSATWITGPRHVVLQVNDDELLTINKTAQGISVSAKVFSADGRIVAQLIENQFHINPSNYFRIEHQDAHSLIVYDQTSQAVLNVRFLNPSSVQVQGIFHHPLLPAPVIINKETVRIERPGKNVTDARLCLGNFEIGILLTNDHKPRRGVITAFEF